MHASRSDNKKRSSSTSLDIFIMYMENNAEWKIENSDSPGYRDVYKRRICFNDKEIITLWMESSGIFTMNSKREYVIIKTACNELCERGRTAHNGADTNIKWIVK